MAYLILFLSLTVFFYLEPVMVPVKMYLASKLLIGVLHLSCFRLLQVAGRLSGQKRVAGMSLYPDLSALN